MCTMSTFYFIISALWSVHLKGLGEILCVQNQGEKKKDFTEYLQLKKFDWVYDSFSSLIA